MVKIRLRRVGAKKQPSFRVVVADSRSPRDGRFIEQIGFYNPRTEPETLQIDEARALHWLSVGAQPTESVTRLLTTTGTLGRFERLRQGEPLDDLLAEAEEALAAEAEEAVAAEEPAAEAAEIEEEEEEVEEAPEAEAAEVAEAEIEEAAEIAEEAEEAELEEPAAEEAEAEEPAVEEPEAEESETSEAEEEDEEEEYSS
ncbi:MAG: 30S ribosomal protein S16 [Chloroflexota bacterium]|nr:30S ribosomal protein S16 [Chloroflexota bacterium]